MSALELTLWGAVQGVGLRFSVRQYASDLGLTGWVKNNADGTVSVWAEGPRDLLQSFLDWCYTGGGTARVDRVAARWQSAPPGFRDFSIRT